MRDKIDDVCEPPNDAAAMQVELYGPAVVRSYPCVFASGSFYIRRAENDFDVVCGSVEPRPQLPGYVRVYTYPEDRD